MTAPTLADAVHRMTAAFEQFAKVVGTLAQEGVIKMAKELDILERIKWALTCKGKRKLKPAERLSLVVCAVLADGEGRAKLGSIVQHGHRLDMSRNGAKRALKALADSGLLDLTSQPALKLLATEPEAGKKRKKKLVPAKGGKGPIEYSVQLHFDRGFDDGDKVQP